MVLRKDTPEYINYIKNLSINFYCEDQLIYLGKMDEDEILSFIGDQSIEIDQNGRKKFKIEYMLSEDVDEIVMGMEHKFDIEFNFDSMDASKTTIIEKVVTGSILVQTGSIIDTKVLIVCGFVLIILGLMFLRKRK